jgi:hypothetical protein
MIRSPLKWSQFKLSLDWQKHLLLLPCGGDPTILKRTLYLGTHCIAEDVFSKSLDYICLQLLLSENFSIKIDHRMDGSALIAETALQIWVCGFLLIQSSKTSSNAPIRAV